MPELLILGLATWRISSLLVNEDGPWDLLGRLRDMLGVTYDEHSLPVGSNVIAKLFTCVWCISPWVAGSVYLSWVWIPTTTLAIMTVLALSTFAVLIERWIDGPR